MAQKKKPWYSMMTQEERASHHGHVTSEVISDIWKAVAEAREERLSGGLFTDGSEADAMAISADIAWRQAKWSHPAWRRLEVL